MPVRIAFFGASGLAGQETLKIMHERSFLADPSVELVIFRGEDWPRREDVYGHRAYVKPYPTTDEEISSFDLAFLALPAEVSQQWAPRLVQQGATVIDYSTAYRMAPGVPLVVAGVNDQALQQHIGIISNPNCVAMPLAIALKPIHDAVGIRKVRVVTQQAVSGVGRDGLRALSHEVMNDLDEQSRQIPPGVFPHQIAYNVLPHVGVALPNGQRTDEERKVSDETRRILDLDIPVMATCTRVSVRRGHCLEVEFRNSQQLGIEKCRELLAASPGVKLHDDLGAADYPHPLRAVGTDYVHVGRIRRVPAKMEANSLEMWIAADNLRVGTALNGVKLAELLCERNLLHRAPV